MGRSLQHVGKGGCHEVACVDVLRGINEKG